MSKVSIQSQIAAVDMAKERADRIIGVSGKAELLKEHLGAASHTLKWLRANEREIRASIAPKGTRT